MCVYRANRWHGVTGGIGAARQAGSMTCQASRESDPEKPAYVSACMSELNAGCNIISLHKERVCRRRNLYIFDPDTGFETADVRHTTTATVWVCACVCRSVGVSV